MKSSGPGPNRRIRAYAYAMVTTALVLILTLGEWATERFVSMHSRIAGTTIEIAIVLLGALVFRPIHQRLEHLVEEAFYYRKRLALEAVAKFRKELSSFNDARQLLRRVIDAVDRHLEADASAIYVRRDGFIAEASSFDERAPRVPLDDPLVIRFHSSAQPARPPSLQSEALGTHAFPMMAAGELIGLLTVHCKHSDYDPDELQMLAGLAQDLGAALVSLDPALRQARTIPNNLPADAQPLIGRERELREIQAALSRSRLVTVTGPGGVGKTRIALACAALALEERSYEHGVWFVDLAPISDAHLIAGTLLSALDVQPEGSDDAARLIEHLRAQTSLIVLDNCEQIVAPVASLVAKLRASCKNLSIIATSRELLHLEGEQVYGLGSLDRGTAVALFARRATAVLPAFDWRDHADAIASICERLDGMPLAIELAAARVRALSVDDILAHLDERFRLLTSSAREGSDRHKTLGATIEWSYGLLTAEEQALFLRLGVFRGSFSLSAAAAVCAHDARCDEFHVLDLLTSLVDKSLLTVSLTIGTRYRLLETIREFTTGKNVERQAQAIVSRQHAAFFAALAAQAYHEFDSRLPSGWLDRLAPDIDNFRAALEWTLHGGGDRQTGAQLAADCGPIFLRLESLNEGLRWCRDASGIPDLPPATAGRISYVESMMHNNLGENSAALEAAERAVASYRESGDERGLVRAISQLAQQYSRAERYDDAKAPAEEAIERAERLNEPRVYSGVLRRCAYSLPPAEIERARELFAKAEDIARAAHDEEELRLIAQWWASREAAAGFLEHAIDIASEALPSAAQNFQLYLHAQIAGWALALHRLDDADEHARRALDISLEVQHPLLRALAMAYSAPGIARQDPERAAAVLGYARARLDELEWVPERDEQLAWANASSAIENAMDTNDFSALAERGAQWSETDALAALRENVSKVSGSAPAAAARS